MNFTGYEGTGVCAWCGGEFPDRRHRTYCSEHCAQTYLMLFHWPEASKAALVRAHYKCEKCGVSCEGLKFCKWKDGYWHYPYNAWNLEVHHIDPIGGDYNDRLWTIKNLPHNLQVLCKDCHREVHWGGGGEERPVSDIGDIWLEAARRGQLIMAFTEEIMVKR